jgi:hypothetical protein
VHRCRPELGLVRQLHGIEAVDIACCGRDCRCVARELEVLTAELPPIELEVGGLSRVEPGIGGPGDHGEVVGQ